MGCVNIHAGAVCLCAHGVFLGRVIVSVSDSVFLRSHVVAVFVLTLLRVRWLLCKHVFCVEV